MKLSKETLEVLKNFATINEGLVVKPGNELTTISPQKTILGKAKVAEKFPVTFGIYNLPNFLSILSMHGEDGDLTFTDKLVTVVSNNGRFTTKYRYTDPSMIVTPPDKELKLSGDTLDFQLTLAELQLVLKAASVSGSPQIAIEGDGETKFVSTFDPQNDSAPGNSLEIGSTDKAFKVVLKTENLKMLVLDYDISIASNAGKVSFVRFASPKNDVTYYVPVEASSKIGA
jgi:hypothetical protein